MLTLTDIEAEVKRRAAIIGAPDRLLPTFGVTRDGGYPHVEVDAQHYHLVTVERGQERERITTPDVDELLYRVFDSVTSSLAGENAVSSQVATQDWRRGLFERQVNLLARLSPAWATRKAAEQQQILRDHPFDDASNARLTLVDALRAGGRSAKEASDEALRQMPLPRAQYAIRPAYPDVFVYDEGDGREIKFTAVNMDEPPRVQVPAREMWAAETPAWAHAWRDLIVERLHAAGCVLFEEGYVWTTIVLPDRAVRIESGHDLPERSTPPNEVRVVDTRTNTLLLQVIDFLVTDVSGFEVPGRLDLQIVGRAGKAETLRIDLTHGTFCMPVTAEPRPLSRFALNPQPGTPAAAVREVRRLAKTVGGDIATAVLGCAFAAGGLWLACTASKPKDRLAGVAGVVLFGATAGLSVRSLIAARKRYARGEPQSLPWWLRVSAYAPLAALVAEAPWLVACVLFVFFLVGDAPFHSTPAKENLFRAVSVLPAVGGLVWGAVALVLGLVRTPVQWTCFALGCLLCAGFVACVGYGLIR